MLYSKLVITSTIAYIFHLERQHKDFTGRHLFFPANMSIERLNTQSVEPKGRPVQGRNYVEEEGGYGPPQIFLKY